MCDNHMLALIEITFNNAGDLKVGGMPLFLDLSLQGGFYESQG